MGPQSKHVYGAAGTNGLAPKTEQAYRVLGSHGLGQQSEHAHELQDFTGWDIRSNMPTRYQFGAAGSQRYGIPDRTCLQGIMMGLQDLTGWKHQIEHAYRV